MTDDRRPSPRSSRQKLWPGPRRRRPRRGHAPGPGAAAVVRRGQGRPRAVQRRSAPTPSATLLDLGYEVFVDLKLHDIPTTVEQAARVLGALGVPATSPARPRRRRHAAGRGRGPRSRVPPAPACPSPWPLAVTVLTSDADAPPHIVPNRVRVAAEAGCGGIVCAAADLPDVRDAAPPA